MRLLIAFLVLAFSLPVAAQDKKADKKTAAAKKADSKVAPAKAGAQKKADPKKAPKKTEKTTAEPKQDWGRFQAQSKKDENERAAAAKAQK